MFPSIHPGLRLAAVASFSLLLGAGQRVAAQIPTTTYTPYLFTTLAGTAGVTGSANGTGAAALFKRPYAVTIDANGNAYVADTQNETIREISPGGAVTTLAGKAGTAAGIDGIGTAALFSDPTGIAVDASGNLYVADAGNDAIRKITPTVAGGVTTWTVSTVAGALGVGGAMDGTGTGARFSQPYGVALDTSGNLYVTDSGNDTIRKITPGGVVTTLAGTEPPAGTPAYAGYVDAIGGAARFSSPYGVAVDTSGNIYVADAGNNRIREITPGGTVTTLAGSASGYTDGTGVAAQFSSPHGVAVDTGDNVYVADTNNYEIRRITAAGVVTTLAGGGSPGEDGAGIDAGFNNPYGVAVGTSGTVYVADTNDSEIRSGVLAPIPPAFTLNASPQTVTVASGRTAVFNAIATGTPAPTYQWTLNGSTTIPGAAVTNDPILVITGATSADMGPIVCTAASSAGSAISSAALTVTTTSEPGYLTNLSGRGLVGVGAANGLFGGFGIAGTGSKQLLIRGIGPRLAMSPFNVADALLDTALTLYAGSPPAQIAFNSPWGGTAALIAADNLVGAYAVPTNSLDSMLYPSPLAAATYSAAVAGVGTAIGDAVVELYDADPAPPPARLINVSVRAPVGTGGDILFGGFVIGGTTAETVLIRGIGPRLAAGPFNLTGVLAQPVLTLFAGTTPTGYSNTGWGSDPALSNAENTVGAYALTPNSADCLLLITLPPGTYSAEITGVNNITGIAAVEVYEVQ